MVEGFWPLVKVRRRQDEGVKEIARLWPELMRNEGVPSPGIGQMLRLVTMDPAGFSVYTIVALAVRSRRASTQWSRGR